MSISNPNPYIQLHRHNAVMPMTSIDKDLLGQASVPIAPAGSPAQAAESRGSQARGRQPGKNLAQNLPGLPHRSPTTQHHRAHMSGRPGVAARRRSAASWSSCSWGRAAQLWAGRYGSGSPGQPLPSM